MGTLNDDWMTLLLLCVWEKLFIEVEEILAILRNTFQYLWPFSEW
jgi:hypothetical protein